MSRSTGSGRHPAATGGGAGRAPGRDKMVGTRPDKYGTRPEGRGPRTPMRPPGRFPPPDDTEGDS